VVYEIKSRLSAGVLIYGALVGGTCAAETAAAQELDLTPGVEATTSIRRSQFDFIDLNADGYVTRSEVDADNIILRSQFDTLDRNDDGKLDKVEFAGFEDVESEQ
jgi:hypothetical protein